jgi:hypothetical protein
MTPADAFALQKLHITSLGFTHCEVNLDDQAIYAGHGLNFLLPATETNPAQIQIHILSAARAAFRNEARRSLEHIIGPIAKI